jgi:hypothetical protein
MRALVALLLSSLACAANHYDTYKAKNPDWYGEFPTAGASLHETLAGIYAPPRGDWQRRISKLSVVRLEEGGPVELTPADLDAVLAEDRTGTYAAIAILGCQSEYAVQSYGGEKVAWFLFVGNRLEAYDSYDFAERCVVFNEFKPAERDRAAAEAAVLAWRDARFPRSMAHVKEFYDKGFAYLRVGRVEEARAMLEQGDRGFDVAGRGEHHVEFEGPSRSVRHARTPDAERSRALLVEGLAKAGAGAPAEP